MLYPNLKAPASQNQQSMPAGQGERSGQTSVNLPQHDLASKLKNPSVQQALDNLIKTSSPSASVSHSSHQPTFWQSQASPYQDRGGDETTLNHEQRVIGYKQPNDNLDNYSHYYVENEGPSGRSLRRSGISGGNCGYKRGRSSHDGQDWRKYRRRFSSPPSGKSSEIGSSSSRFVLPPQVVSGGGMISSPNGNQSSQTQQPQYTSQKSMSVKSGSEARVSGAGGGSLLPQQQQKSSDQYCLADDFSQQQSNSWYVYGSNFGNY